MSRELRSIDVNQNVSEEGWIQINFTSSGYTTPGPKKTVWLRNKHDLEEIYAEANWAGWYIPLWVTPFYYGDSIVWGAYPAPEELVDLGYGYASILFDEPGIYDIWAYTYSECGLGYPIYLDDFHVYDYGFFLSPNPATDEVEVTVSDGISENLNNASLQDEEYMVTVTDIYGIAKSRKKYKGRQFTISIEHLKEGNYFVILSNDKMNKTEQLIIKR